MKIFIFKIDGLVDHIKVKDYIPLEDSIMAIPGMSTPLITLCFIDDETLFVNLFKRTSKEHWYFMYSVK